MQGDKTTVAKVPTVDHIIPTDYSRSYSTYSRSYSTYGLQ